MKTHLLAFMLSTMNTNGLTTYTFYYNTDKIEYIRVQADSRTIAFKKAAKLCFQALNPRYTTEEEGLTVIDICANPRKVVESD